jgi:hypothetical protein
MSSAGEWVFSDEQLRNTPSQRLGLSQENEDSMRRSGVALIADLVRLLEVPSSSNVATSPTYVTASVYFHRFFMVNDFQGIDFKMLACAAVFLALKVVEAPRQGKVVMDAYFKVTRGSDVVIDPTSREFTRQREVMVTAELGLLHALAFDFTVELPLPLAWRFLNTLDGENEWPCNV